MALAVLLAAGAVRAEAPYGSVQVQYQKLDEAALFQRGDGSVELRQVRQEYFLRSVDVRQQSYLRPNLLLESSFRMSERSVVDTRNLSRTPTGGLRLVHPFFQFVASHQPAWERTAYRTAAPGGGADSVERTVTTRHNESIVAAHVAVPRWPRLDATWIDRRRRSDARAGDRSRSGSVRVSLDRERYSTYASVNQSRFTSDAPGSPTNLQTLLAGGGSYVYAPRPDLSFRAQYDGSDVLATTAGVSRPGIVSHSALLDGNWLTTPKWTTSSNLQWRRTGTGIASVPARSTEEGSLTSRYQFSRRSGLLGGSGFRSVTVLRNGVPADGHQVYGTAVYMLDAPVRRQLAVSASASHTTNWDPDRAPYGIEALTTTARGRMNRRLSADFSWQLAATGDSAASGSRYGTSWAFRLQAVPLRTLSGFIAFRSQRSGPGLFQPNSVTHGITGEANWRPAPRVEVYGQYSSTRFEPGAMNGLSTWAGSLRFEPARGWQSFTNWTRSSQRLQVSLAGQLSSREVLMTRLQYAPNRRLAANAALSYNDPGRDHESRRLDVTLVWSFGR